MSGTDRPALKPGAAAGGRATTLGVLGGGQLGRMFVHAAQSLGFATVVLDPDATSPAGAAADAQVRAAYDDGRGLAEMADRCDALTTEFENVPAPSLATLAARRPVSPSAEAVAVCQHRLREKRHIESAGVPCVPHAALQTDADLAAVPAALLPGLL